MCEAKCSLTRVVYSHNGHASSLGPALDFLVLFLVGADDESSRLFLLLLELEVEDRVEMLEMLPLSL